MSTIPASAIVKVNPNVLSPGGRALDIVGVMLTHSTRVPIGAVQPFSSAADVGSYFGLSSAEYLNAQVYFKGFDNSNVKPTKLYFAQYANAAVAAFLRGGSLSGVPLATLQSYAGTLTISWDGTPHTSSNIDLSSASSPSNAATLIQAGFSTPPFTVAYDSVSGAFVFTGTSTGATHTVGYATTGAFATNLKLTLAAGAVTSQGADAAIPGPFMDGVVLVTQDWATFMTLFDPDSSGNVNKLAFAAWANTTDDRYAYVCWDTDTEASVSVPATQSLGYLIGPNGNNYSGTFIIGRDVNGIVDSTYAAFVCGIGGSIDFTEHDGRTTFAFRKQSGLLATCTNQTSGDNLIANGYNFYGAYATANDNFVFLYPGSISGDFLWMDSYVNEIWLNNQLQLSLMELLVERKSIPYNTFGYTLIEAACLDVIQEGLNFGAFRAGVTLSASQIAEVNAAAGIKIDGALNEQGWYLQVLDADPQVRVARGSPPMTFWYMDGQSVQKINLTSIDVQ